MKVEISEIELLALKKLALVSNALAMTLSDVRASRAQRSLTKVLVDVIGRAQSGTRK